MITITPTLLSDLSPQTEADRKADQTTIVDDIAPIMQASFEPAGLNTVLRVANFLAQVCEECDSFCTVLEYDSGRAYNGRKDLGNTQPGDGPRFKGRGIIMLTGRSNYTLYGKLLNLDLVNDPDLAAEPANAVAIAIAYWNQNGLNALADQDNIVAITRRINGGLNGLATRQLFLARAKSLLQSAVKPTPPPEPAAPPVTPPEPAAPPEPAIPIKPTTPVVLTSPAEPSTTV